MRNPLMFLLLAGLAGCAGHTANSSRTPGPCDLLSGDSSFAQRGPVYLACAVDRPATLMGARPTLAWPLGPDQCVSAEVRFVVDTAGAPEPALVQITRTNDPSFARAYARSIASRRYEPALRGGTAVRQIVTDGQISANMITRTPIVPGQVVSRPPC
jgi:hypothetical protein